MVVMCAKGPKLGLSTHHSTDSVILMPETQQIYDAKQKVIENGSTCLMCNAHLLSDRQVFFRYQIVRTQDADLLSEREYLEEHASQVGTWYFDRNSIESAKMVDQSEPHRSV